MLHTFYLRAAVLVCVLAAFSVRAQAPATPLAHLTRLSDREYVDLSKVAFVRLPVYTPPPAGCSDCQTRWGADMVVDGVDVSYTVEAEQELRRLLPAGSTGNR